MNEFSALASQKGNPLSLQDCVFIFTTAPKYNSARAIQSVPLNAIT